MSLSCFLPRNLGGSFLASDATPPPGPAPRSLRSRFAPPETQGCAARDAPGSTIILLPSAIHYMVLHSALACHRHNLHLHAFLPCLESLGASTWEDIRSLSGITHAEIIQAHDDCAALRLAQRRRLLLLLNLRSPPPSSPPLPPPSPSAPPGLASKLYLGVEYGVKSLRAVNIASRTILHTRPS